MKKVATVLAVATVTMATTMDNFGDENLMINPYASKMPGSHVPIPQRDVYIRKPILDKVVAADEFGDDHFAVDDFGDDNFAVDEFGDDNFAVDEFGDDNFIAAIPKNPYAEHYKPSRQELREKLLKQHAEARGTLPSPRHGGVKPTKPTKKPIAADEFADEEMWSRTDLNKDQPRPRVKIIAHDRVEYDDEFFAADEIADDNFAAEELGPRKFGFFGPRKPGHEKTEKTEKTGEQSGHHKLGPRKYGLFGPRKPIQEKTVAADEFDNEFFAADDFGDDNFAVDNFGDEELFVGTGNPHVKLIKGKDTKKPVEKAIAADEFADEEMWSRTDLPLHPVNRDRIKPMPWMRAHDKVVAADEFVNEFFAADDFGDDNFAVDNFGDEELFVGTGNPHVKLIKGDKKEHTKKPVEKAIAADEFADENFAVEFDDEEFMVRRPVNPHFDLHKAEGKEHKERKEHIKKPVEKVIAADELADDNYFVDDFGDDNFAVDLGDDYFAVDLGDDYFAVDLGDDYFAVDTFGDDNFAVDDFADENLAVEFGDDELVYTQGRLEKPLPLRDPHTPSLRGGSLYQLDKLLREAH